MDTPEPESVSPVHIPADGLPVTEDRKTAWVALEIASHGYTRNLDDLAKRELFHKAIADFERACREAESQRRTAMGK